MDPQRLYLFLGAPGSGKGTLSKKCIDALGFEQLSTGNLCREHIAQQSEIGKKIDLALKSGKLIDDSLVTAMVFDWLAINAASKNIILDGFPRTIIQADSFNAFVQKQQDFAPLVVRLKVTEQTVIDRLTMRLICSKEGCQAVYSLAPGSSCCPRSGEICDLCSAPLLRRSDDEIESIRKRLHIYDSHEAQLLDFYANHGYETMTLDASKPVHEIFEEFKQKVGSFT